MKRKLWLLALVGAVLLSAVPVLADGDFYVVAGGGRTGMQVSSLPYTINSPGLYCLSGNLSATGNGIIINASDVTLDLMGFCLTGPGSGLGSPNSCGIYIQANCTNVEIRNGSLKNFRNAGGSSGGGIRAETTTSGIRVIGVRAQGIYDYGIALYGTDNLVTGCSVMTSSGGIIVGYGSIVKGNHVAENTVGIYADNGSTLVGNVCKSNSGGYGISTNDACSVLDNSLLNNSQYGILTGNYCTITRNTANGTASVGIKAGDNCTITNNTTQGLTKGTTNCTDAQNTVY